MTAGAQYCQATQDGRCVTTGPGNYGNYEACTVEVGRTGMLSATAFNTQSIYDYVAVGNARYSGAGVGNGPARAPVAAGDTFSWISDRANTGGGWTLCLKYTNAPAPSPTASPVVAARFNDQHAACTDNHDRYAAVAANDTAYHPGATIVLPGFDYVGYNQSCDTATTMFVGDRSGVTFRLAITNSTGYIMNEDTGWRACLSDKDAAATITLGNAVPVNGVCFAQLRYRGHASAIDQTLTSWEMHAQDHPEFGIRNDLSNGCGQFIQTRTRTTCDLH